MSPEAIRNTWHVNALYAFATTGREGIGLRNTLAGPSNEACDEVQRFAETVQSCHMDGWCSMCPPPGLSAFLAVYHHRARTVRETRRKDGRVIEHREKTSWVIHH